MPDPGNGSRRFSVHCSGAITEVLLQLQRQASESGRGTAFVRAFRKIIKQPVQRAPEVGEPLYRLAGLRIPVRTVVISALVADSGVCEDRPPVLIESVCLLSSPI